LRVAINLGLDSVRRRPRLPSEREHEPDAQEIATLRVALAAALAALPRRQRQIVALRHIAGLSEVETASTLGLSLGTVKTHTRRGLESLRRRLGDYDPERTALDAQTF
jgi:RNA polymerase sigma factor (sigma-70 family)